MRRLSWLASTLALVLALGGCNGGGTNPTDGGPDDGDGGQVECTSAAECDDGNVCTDDACVDGACVYTNNSDPCDDGQVCSEDDVCSNGVCSGTAVGCDDGNPCTNDSCDDEEGCVYIPNSAPCDDGDACTLGDVCSEGSCQGGTVRECDDGNVCTDDACDPAEGCVYTPNDAACDDGQACSSNDHCSNGVCVGDSDVDCDDDNPCTEDRCDDSLGCVHSYNVAACDDGSACTENDACNQGTCQGRAIDCGDNNPCTNDSCDPAAGCQYENNSDPCDDGDVCSVGDTCAGGTCQPGSARTCDDNNVCTDDQCVPGLGCTHANNTAACDDGDACTTGDHCQDGTCVGGDSPFDCDDGNPCTDDLCHPVNGCSYEYNSDPCDDGDPCTIDDVCANGVCAGGPADADGDGYIAEACGGQDCDDSAAAVNPGVFEGPDGDPKCTDGVDNNCNDLTDAEEAACNSCIDNADCDDDNVCNGAEICDGGTCVAGTPLDCDDGELCTTDNCDPAAGCQYVDNSLPCNDGDACTVGDTCSGGSCQGGGALDCDDNDPCTDDGCDPDQGCVYNFNDAPCDDGDDCTTGDYCQAGACMPGAGGPDCDDGNPCTEDSCIDGVGCVNQPVDDGTGCDDGSLCTENDHCSNGTCTGSSVNCDDGNVCTSDDCDPDLGCVHDPVAGDCNDGDACTVDDHCSAGNCVGDIRDQDGDGYGDELCGGEDCCDSGNEPMAGCDAGSAPGINPGAAEACGDGVDNNCNDVIDEGCASCDTVDPAAQLVIDNDQLGGAYGLAQGDQALNVFFVESTSYNVIEVQAAFYDLTCGVGGDEGDFSVHLYADDGGLPGAELAASATETVSRAGGCDPDTDPQQVAWHTFTLAAPQAFTQGQLIWVALQIESDEVSGGDSADQFVPWFSPPVAVPYHGGFVYETAGDQYGYAGGNWLLRVDGCAEGPWLTLDSHSASPAILPAGGSTSVTAGLYNRGFADSNAVSGVLACEAPEIVLTSDTADFGPIAVGAAETGSPAYGVSAAAGSYGIYTMALTSSDGPNEWQSAFGLYVQGAGCATENATLAVDSGTPTYFLPLGAGEEAGNYFAVQSTALSVTSVTAQLYNNSGVNSSRFRAKLYSYRAGLPDQLLATSAWVSVSGSGVIEQDFTFAEPVTLRQDNTVFAMIESESDLSATEFGMLTDDGDSQAGSWNNAVYYSQAEGWMPFYGMAMMVRINGCQATELEYDSHSSNPDPISAGDSATLTITVRNSGAEDATDVSGTLSSSDADITVTTATRSYGTVAAGGTDSASGFAIDVAAGADQYQYLLDLELSDGVNTWTDQVPIQLAGGTLNLTVQNFTTTLVGNDIQYHWEVVNDGNVDVTGSFAVDLYVDRDTAPGTGEAGDWTDNPAELAVGESIPYDLVMQDAPDGVYDAYVQVDTNDAVAEGDEGDNVAGPSTTEVGNAAVFELLDPARKWFVADMPVNFRFVSSNSISGMSENDSRDAVRNGFDQWQNVATASISFAEVGATSAGNAGYRQDGYNTMTFDDITGEVPEGALGATLPVYSGQTTQTNGVTFYRMTDADIVFNDGVSFVRNGAACNYDFDLDGVATHEIGHLVGLDHPDVYEATMYYAVDYCDMSKVSLADSDIAGVTFIYP